MQSLVYHFVANFVLFQKDGGSFWKFCLCEALQPLQVTSFSCVISYTLEAKGLTLSPELFKNNFRNLSVEEWMETFPYNIST